MESFITTADTPREPQFETYKKISLLGKGSFGKAFLVQCGSDKVSHLGFIIIVFIELSRN